MDSEHKALAIVAGLTFASVLLIIAMNLVGSAACRSAGLKAGESAIDVKEMCR